MFQLAFGPCKRDWGQNTLHCRAAPAVCKILLPRVGALIAKCATLFSSALPSRRRKSRRRRRRKGFKSILTAVLTLALAEFLFIPSPNLLSDFGSCSWLHLTKYEMQFYFCHILQFLMKELTFIHSIIDRSSIVLVQIPLKTARFRSFCPAALLPAEFICLLSAASPPLIYSNCLQGSQTVRAFSTAKSESNLLFTHISIVLSFIWLHIELIIKKTVQCAQSSR